ncbi:transaldolase [candidate division KSB3 bacterium]|uniref:Transaldolase n=1 Tax=candidate division KSB3 bacterium TaxID=2044937 RepID=A0A2G6KDJ4_9BACT|nr:MAG: transaldolase [candidate division KSB3 bacterium]
MSAYNSPLQEMAATTNTDYWNDSCAVSELTYAIERGAVGATTNPVIVYNVLKKEMHLWEERIAEILTENPTFNEDEVAWQLIEEMAVKGSELLLPVFEKEKGLKGRISIQTNAKFYRNAEAMTEQAVTFSKLAPNMQVKMPVTKAGIQALEESTYQGVNVNATVCFTVPQAVAAAEAVERGLKRRETEGKKISDMTPVCTIMVGRLDDWLKIVADREDIIIDPAYLDMAGVAAMKRAVQIYKERGYRLRMLTAAYRSQLHWSMLIGDGIIHTIPYKWQVRYNRSDVPIVDTTDKPMDPQVIEDLSRKFEDFRKAYEPDGMSVEEFDSYGATKRTLKQFIGGYNQLLDIVRGFMLPGV